MLTEPDARVSRADIGLDRDRPVLAVAGTTNDLEPDRAEMLFPFMLAAVGAAARSGAVIVTGGTDSGVFHMLGLALAAAPERPPAVIGVAPAALIADGAVPGADGRTPIDPQLTALVRTPGDTWGDESAWLSDVASVLSNGYPSVTLLLNGGEIAYTDVRHSLAAGRPVVVVRGSGRTADAIAAAAR